MLITDSSGGGGVTPAGPSGGSTPSQHTTGPISPVEIALDTRVGTLGQFKATLESSLGPAGAKLYEQFIDSMVKSMITQLQQASAHAAAAVKKMREGPQ